MVKRRLIAEEIRIQEQWVWEKWGPYVSERQWGTVREDYSANSEPWDYLTHDMARSYAYHWGEDGIAGYSDRYQVVCLSLALWNHQDPILKERLFGLAPNEGNHSEDVKELYYYLDASPSYAYMKYLYKYPQRAFPYEELINTNRNRTKKEAEYELFDTGIFDDNRYFDVFVEYIKMDDEDTLVVIEVINRGPEAAKIDIIPQLTFRNIWSWEKTAKPAIWEGKSGENFVSMEFDDDGVEAFPMLDIEYRLGRRYLYAEKGANLLFTENETNREKLFAQSNQSPFVKDAFHRYIIDKESCINEKKRGTKAAFYYKDCLIPPGGSKKIRLRLSQMSLEDPLANICDFKEQRKKETDLFYEMVYPERSSLDEQKIMRQAISGLLWSKQLYLFIVNYWLRNDHREVLRNTHWKHLVSKHTILMPDKWEYPWFAAWDLSFHCLTMALVDMNYAKDQLYLLLRENFQHPSGQIPAYEWEYSDLNPPVQAWVALKLYNMEKEKTGRGDLDFLRRCYHKLLINFSWWVNQVDSLGNNVFEGGFLGLDNITVVDRSKHLENGTIIEQSDGTGWMGMFCLNMMRMSIELSKEDSSYENMITKFFQHFIYIASALICLPTREVQNWDEEDGFFYDVLAQSDGRSQQIRVRSLVGIIPLYASDWISEKELRLFKEFYPQFTWFLDNRPELAKHCITPIEKDGMRYYLFSLANPDKMQRVLNRIWDPKEFRSKYGLRSLSKYHKDHPFELLGHAIHYTPAESQIDMYGGNSNWRGPIWFPTSYLFIETLLHLHELLKGQMKISAEGEDPVDLKMMAKYFADALISVFTLDDEKRAYLGEQKDPHFRDHLLFNEYFHGDTGKGLGASHQTGWTALVANLIERFRR